jgi:hypothetical protein
MDRSQLSGGVEKNFGSPSGSDGKTSSSNSPAEIAASGSATS